MAYVAHGNKNDEEREGGGFKGGRAWLCGTESGGWGSPGTVWADPPLYAWGMRRKKNVTPGL